MEAINLAEIRASIETRRNATDALASINADKYDVVLLDVTDEKVSGDISAAMMKGRIPCPVVALVRNDTDSSAYVSPKSGFSDCVAKNERGYRRLARHLDHIINVSKLRQAREELLESTTRYRSLFDQILDAVAVFGFPDGRLILWNKRFPRFSGYVQSDLAGRNLRDFFPKENLADVWAYLHRRAAEDAVEGSCQAPWKSPDGEQRWVDIYASPYGIDGELKGVQVVLRDITDIRRSGDVLQESQRLLSGLLYQSPVSTLVLDKAGCGVMCNDACRRLFSLPREIPPTKYNIREDKQLAAKGFAEIVDRVFKKGENAEFTTDYDIRHMGEPAQEERDDRYLRFYLFPIRNDDGAMVNVVVQHDDVTERRKAENEREKLQTQLLHAQKMEAIGNLAGGIAHDFNNLLSAVLGAASLLKIGVRKNLPYYSEVETIEAAATQAAELTRRLLSFAKGEQMQVAALNLNEVVDRAAQLASHSMSSDIRVEIDLEPGIWTVKGDADQIEQCLVNLCMNARDAMAQGGVLTISTRNLKCDDSIRGEIPELKRDYYAILTVRDTGKGMDENTKRHIFEPFYTTKPPGKGTGLGLSMIYTIMTRHDGHIGVESSPGNGATFELFLPATPESALLTPPKPVTAIPSGTETILVVDDEDRVRDTIRRMLEKLGYTVLAAQSIESAMDAYRSESEKVKLIILDMQMPGGGAAKAFGEFRGINPSAPVLLTSGYTVDKAARDMVAQGALGFLQKPFQLLILAEKVRNALDGNPPGLDS